MHVVKLVAGAAAADAHDVRRCLLSQVLSPSLSLTLSFLGRRVDFKRVRIRRRGDCFYSLPLYI